MLSKRSYSSSRVLVTYLWHLPSLPITTNARLFSKEQHTVIEARDIIRNVPKDPTTLYVTLLTLALSGNTGNNNKYNKVGKTERNRNRIGTPSWDETFTLTVEPSCVFSFRLKHTRKWPSRPAVIGFIEIEVNELLDRCKDSDGQRTTLPLHDEEGQEVGSLVVQLLDLTVHATQASGPSTSSQPVPNVTPAQSHTQVEIESRPQIVPLETVIDVAGPPPGSETTEKTSTTMLDSVAREAPCPSHYQPTATSNVDMRIRALTTILSILDPQASSPTKNPTSIEFKVAKHIATLLTRGMDKKRGMMGPNIQPIAVTTRMTVGSMNILVTVDNAGLANDFVVTQSPTSEGFYAFGPTEIESKDLDDVQRDELLNSDRLPEDITLGQHAADVMSLFNNIRTAQPIERANLIWRVTTFIVRRCAPIISHRLRSDKFIFQDTTLDKILQGWKPSDGDHFVKTECEIPQRLVTRFQKMGINCRQLDGKYLALWTKEIAPAWMETFLSALSWCKDCFELEGKKVAGNPTMGATVLKFLQALVASEGFKYLLELESVNTILDREVLKCQRARYNNETLEDPQSHDDNSELTAETEEDSVALTMRYLGNAVAWITATDFLFSSSHIRCTPKLQLYFVITAPPTTPKLMADAPTIFMDIFNKSLEDQEDQPEDYKLTAHAWSGEFAQRLQKSQEFHGTVHCEASLMGAIVHYNGQANTEGSVQNIFHSTSNKPRTIGVATKCCWCCNTLATLLNSSTDIQFGLPGSHGQIFPWALPHIGISYEVACSLEDRLQKQLLLAIHKRLEKLKNIHESQTSNLVSDEGTVINRPMNQISSQHHRHC